MASHPRTSSSFSLHLLFILNFFIFILSSASLALTFIFRTPPTALGWALFTASTLSILSSFIGFISQLTQCWLIAHSCFLITSLIADALAFLALFWQEKQSIRAVGSPRNPQQVKILIKMDCGIFLSMFLLQLAVLVLACTFDRAKEQIQTELEKADITRRSRKMARIQVESMENANMIADKLANEFEEKMKSKTWR